MTFRPSSERSRAAVAARTALLLALGLGIAACGGQDDANTAAGPAAEAPAEAAAPVADATAEAEAEAAATAGKLAAMSAEELREAGRTAYAENRLYAPAGDNAVEYYLALREKAPGDAAASSALTDLLPMTVIAIEQSVQREDFAEAARLAALLERADPQHPAVARLKASIAEQQVAMTQRLEQERVSAEEQARRQEELERQRVADQQRQQEEAAQQLAAQQEAARQQAEREAAERAAAEQAAAQAAAATPAPAPAQQAAPARATAADLRPISTPAPRYPSAAMRARTSGEVQVEFTVGTDGSVTSARVVRSNPARVFDREAVAAVREWRFQPIPNTVTTRRTIGFNPGG
ncbi:energy transducer TonB [Lysobacter sp. SG-8]|uniref:Protein TonB n=1 Tax=Marilutibacter penaei TaxID=2759900 RepID=A0A7W3U4J6_9GAMM|nr:energy transducer TonB [Lysobacter penaei]MBB1088747.1 energy transducer TonB [Lysobacter penaei]